MEIVFLSVHLINVAQGDIFFLPHRGITCIGMPLVQNAYFAYADTSSVLKTAWKGIVDIRQIL